MLAPDAVRIRKRATDETGTIGAVDGDRTERCRASDGSRRAWPADPAHSPPGRHKARAAATSSSARDRAATARRNGAAGRRRTRGTDAGQALGRCDGRNITACGIGCTGRDRTILAAGCSIPSTGCGSNQARFAGSRHAQSVGCRDDISGTCRGAAAGSRRQSFQVSARKGHAGPYGRPHRTSLGMQPKRRRLVVPNGSRRSCCAGKRDRTAHWRKRAAEATARGA